MWPTTLLVRLLIVGIVLFLAMVVFVYLLVAGADESRRKDRENDENYGERGSGQGGDD